MKKYINKQKNKITNVNKESQLIGTNIKTNVSSYFNPIPHTVKLLPFKNFSFLF